MSIRMFRAFMVIMGFTLFRLPRPYSTPKRVFAPLQLLSILVLLAVFVAVARRASGYVPEGKAWPAGTVVTFQMGLGSAGRTLIDGNTSWDTAAAPALTAWDNITARLQYKGNVANPPVSSGDGVNAVVFSNTVFGQQFGSGTLAVTYWRSSGNNIIEADILFNRNQSFDSYRGPLRFNSRGWSIGDIRRVFIHELGHALGLDHPDQHGQHVDAIMNSVTSDRETLSTDDISGAQSIYGAPTPTPTPTPTPNPSGSHFGNISTRVDVGTGNNVMIAGFMVWGTQSKTVIVRVLGPTLGSYGVANALSDPMLELHNSSGATIATNDDWQTGSQASQISSSGYAPNNANESTLIATLAAGAYTAIVRGYNNSTGIALVEVYELDTLSTRLSNISTRGQVGTNQNVLIGGFIINGSTSKKMIVRAVGPSLASPPFSLSGALSNPTLELHDSSGNLLASNDDWGSGTQAAAISASGYKPPNARESAIIATLASGNYTAIVRGVNNSTGIALVDAYDLDP
jgi:Matrixin